MPQKLNVKKLGVVFGTFAPMHTGHVSLITRAKRENDAVLVVVSGTNDETDRGTRAGLHLNRRFRYVREVFNNDELTRVVKLDETGIPTYPNGWNHWLQLLHKLIHDNAEFPSLHFYVGEEEYVSKIDGYFSTRFSLAQRRSGRTEQVTLVERSTIPVSATAIRENPLAYWRYITKPFRRHFTKKVLVIGSASGGKTTLVQDLGQVYNAPVSLEYARAYQARYNVRDDELDVNDYIHLLADQYKQTSDIIDEGSHSGIVFADTNSSVTQAYIDYYLKDEISDEDYAMLTQLYEATFRREQWDLIFLVPPKSTYVDDGFRDMGMSDQTIRDEFTNHLLELIEPFKDKLVILDSEPDNFFIDNFNKVVETIDQKLNIQI